MTQRLKDACHELARRHLRIEDIVLAMRKLKGTRGERVDAVALRLGMAPEHVSELEAAARDGKL